MQVHAVSHRPLVHDHKLPGVPSRSGIVGCSTRRRGRRCCAVGFRDEDKEELEHIRERLDELREQRHRQRLARERLMQGAPGSLHDITQAVEESKKGQDINTEDAYKVTPLQAAFTRRREIFVGRVAMTGFVAACFWEVILPSHPGILQQLSLVTHLSPANIATALLVFTTWQAFISLAPGSPTWDRENFEDIAKRPPGPPCYWVNPIKRPFRFLGLGDRFQWGFNKPNELFHARLAMLGFAGALVNEVRLGGVGPMAQLAGLLGVPCNELYYELVAWLSVCALAINLAYTMTASGSTHTQRDSGIY